MLAPRPASSDSEDAERRIAALHLAALEIDEQRSRPCGGYCGALRQLRHEARDPIAHGHAM